VKAGQKSLRTCLTVSIRRPSILSVADTGESAPTDRARFNCRGVEPGDLRIIGDKLLDPGSKVIDDCVILSVDVDEGDALVTKPAYDGSKERTRGSSAFLFSKANKRRPHAWPGHRRTLLNVGLVTGGDLVTGWVDPAERMEVAHGVKRAVSSRCLKGSRGSGGDVVDDLKEDGQGQKGMCSVSIGRTS
jgi:hypothetical protein